MTSFIGGPLDGLKFEGNEVNAIAEIVPVRSSIGVNRLFLHVPDKESCDKILRGELPKGQEKGARYFYERAFLKDRSVEFRHVSDVVFAQALKSENEPLNSEQLSQKQMIDNYAEQFGKQLEGKGITDRHQVYLIYRYETRTGAILVSSKSEIDTRVRVDIPGDKEAAHKMASGIYARNLIGNVQSAVKGVPLGWFNLQAQSGLEVRVIGFEIVVENPSE